MGNKREHVSNTGINREHWEQWRSQREHRAQSGTHSKHTENNRGKWGTHWENITNSRYHRGNTLRTEFSFKKAFEGTHWEHREHTGYIHTGNVHNEQWGSQRGHTRNILRTIGTGNRVNNREHTGNTLRKQGKMKHRGNTGHNWEHTGNWGPSKQY